MKRAFSGVICFLLLGCVLSRHKTEPTVEFTLIPAAETGGTMRLTTIEGRVINVRPDQRIVLYARSGNWYVQPFADRPFTIIESDSSWSSTTHLGTEYAALLVEPGYEPPSETVALPNREGAVTAVAVVRGTPEFWRSWWFRLILAIACIFLLIGYFRARMLSLTREMQVRFEERLAERTRIAQELHDSLLQGFVSVSMQLAVTAENLPADSPAKPQLKRILKTIEKVVEEGRSTVQGLRAPGDRPDLERQLTELGRELDGAGRFDFRMTVEGPPQKLAPAIADEIHHIGREALINAFRHSEARRIEVEIEYAVRHFRLVVRDDGIGIDPSILESGRERHWGLTGLRERSENIGAKLRVLSRRGAGTEIELIVPNDIAFETPRRPFGWLPGFGRRQTISEKE